jgi:hypothetical protein
MEVAINVEDAALLAVVSLNVSELVVQGLQLLNDLHALGSWQGSGAASGEALETANDGVEFGRVFFCQGGDDHAALIRHPVLANISFLLEFVEGSSNGRAADMKPFGEVSFDDPGSGRELPVDD